MCGAAVEHCRDQHSHEFQVARLCRSERSDAEIESITASQAYGKAVCRKMRTACGRTRTSKKQNRGEEQRSGNCSVLLVLLRGTRNMKQRRYRASEAAAASAASSLPLTRSCTFRLSLSADEHPLSSPHSHPLSSSSRVNSISLLPRSVCVHFPTTTRM